MRHLVPALATAALSLEQQRFLREHRRAFSRHLQALRDPKSPLYCGDKSHRGPRRRGAPLGEPDPVEQMRRLFQDGLDTQAIAARLSVEEAVVANALAGSREVRA